MENDRSSQFELIYNNQNGHHGLLRFNSNVSIVSTIRYKSTKHRFCWSCAQLLHIVSNRSRERSVENRKMHLEKEIKFHSCRVVSPFGHLLHYTHRSAAAAANGLVTNDDDCVKVRQSRIQVEFARVIKRVFSFAPISH